MRRPSFSPLARRHDDDAAEDDGLLERLFGSREDAPPTAAPPRRLPRQRTGDIGRSGPHRVVFVPSAVAVPSVVVAVVAVLALVYVLVGQQGGDGPAPPAASPADRLGFPSAVPPGTEYVRSRLLGSGEVEVDHWIASRRPVRLLVAPPPQGPDDSDVRAERVRVETSEGTTQGSRIVETQPRTYFVGGFRQVHVSYVLTGAVAPAGGGGNQVVLSPASLDLDLDGDRLPRVVELVGGRVVSAACGGAVAGRRSCGQPEGRSWRVRLEPRDRDDVVTARVDVRPGR